MESPDAPRANEAYPSRDALLEGVRRAAALCPVTDMHTHLVDARFGPLLLRGADDLLSYHYLAAELFRADPRRGDGRPLQPEEYLSLPAAGRAQWAWDKLFLEQAPLSEAARGVCDCLSALAAYDDGGGGGGGHGGGGDEGGAPLSRDLDWHRARTASWTPRRHIDTVMEIANVEAVVMPTDPFDDLERPVWEKAPASPAPGGGGGGGGDADPRFWAALRLDRLLADWPGASARLRGWGYKAGWTPAGPGRAAGPEAQKAETVRETRRFLRHWVDVMRPAYLALSAGAAFDPYDGGVTEFLVRETALPLCRERGLPLALMIGVSRQANPRLGGAGDSVRLADLAPLARLCAEFPEQPFLATVLARENQHELCVLARKFGHLHPFGCWWFLNNPSLIGEMTRMRLELLGPAFTAQHSDARVLDQLIYKWRLSRAVVGQALAGQYGRLWDAGWRVTPAEAERDMARILGGGNFRRIVKR